jgi:hypothetical protein
MTGNEQKRASTLAEFSDMMDKVFVPEEVGSAIASYHPQANDIIISPYGKCGTTWLQQAFHTLRTGGDMDFDDISRVVPWIEQGAMHDIDLNSPQRAQPRGFKSHLSYSNIPKGAKYVVSFRDPKDAFVSMFRFMEGWFIEPDTISMEEFFEGWMNGGPEGDGYWGHLLSWWEQRDDPNLLLVTYDHMIADPKLHVLKLAAFCDLAIDDELLALTLDRSSLSYMLENKNRFDDALARAQSEIRCNLPPGSDSSKVRKGGVGGYKKELPSAIAERIDAIWSERVTPVTGHKTYAMLATEIRNNNNL